MYANFFGLQQEPFSIAPDPRYLFMSERHREALAHLLYGLRGGGGFVLLTGEIGAGKTTVCRCFLEQIPAQDCNVAYIFNPKLTVTELLKTVCEEYHIELGPGELQTVKPYVDALNNFLLAQHGAGRNTVLIIDEAQNLAPSLLEQLRLLTNLETRERKLLQIILIGQPELRTMLAAPELEQMAQRVIARFHLQALSEAETAQYVRHRLGVAGFGGALALPFDRTALRQIHRLSRGVPRRINLLCDRALLGAYAQGRKRIDRATLDKAAAEVFDDAASRRNSGFGRRRAWMLGAGGALTAAAVFALATRSLGPEAGRPVTATAAAASAPASAASGASSVAAASAASTAVAEAASAPAPRPDPAATITLALRSEADAWRELAAAWALQPPKADADFAELCAGLRKAAQTRADPAPQCFTQSSAADGGLALLRLLDRPAILTLHDASGEPAYVLLQSLGSQHATVSAGGHTQTVSLLALDRQWRGEFRTLWRAPPAYQGRITSGPLPAWLDAQLDQAFSGAPAADGAPVPLSVKYDQALRAKVAAFQRAQGLKSDGLAGPVTLMLLNRASGIGEPRLQQALAGH
ncbi:AAA family ATPase [Paucibacter sp. PLA-PC-4]|uniref:ExeA family protein n=1 Tax=Paucibacter sp. PLA-PC-4 TaxID=2993655 RepID=UPI002248C480|nr:ExeA family protein [Paucibacter sp. PLA-PC-4]MCX2862391.1 AAA family ATPase [Paucibacter sp. PLA-PC-4]